MAQPDQAVQDQAAEDQAGPVSFKAICGGCQRTVSRRSPRARTWKCPYCHRVNPGPGLVAEMAKPPEKGARRRLQRRAAAAEEVPTSATPTTSTTSAPAPVRRKPKAGAETTRAGSATQPRVSSKGPASAPATPPPAPRRTGFFDRLLYGDDE